MPQLFQVLRCFKCSVFQVHQTKKTNKWQCKLCGEKQSIRRHYGLGTSKECRGHVQKLNGIRGEVDELKNSLSIDEELNSISEDEDISPIVSHKNTVKNSKWADFTTENETNAIEIDGNNHLNDKEVVLELPPKSKIRKTMRESYYKNKKERHVDEEITDKNIDINATTISRKISKFIPPSKLIKQESFNFNKLESEENKHFLNRLNEDTDEDKYYTSSYSKNNVILDFNDPKCNEEISIPLENVIVNYGNITECQNKNSKWAQFIGDDVEYNSNQEKTDIFRQHNSPPLFSITEDSDLDNILNI